MKASEAKARGDRAYSDQVPYNQNAVDNHGQADGMWRVDCSGLVCAVFALPTGINCPSTFELAHGANLTGAPYDDRHRVKPWGTVTMVTNEDGSPFGHVAIVIDYDARGDRLRIMEHGGGVGPDIRWLPSGVNYDSERQYGHHRNFRLYDLDKITGAVPDSPPKVPTVKGTPFPYPGGVIGLRSDPSASVHGGINDQERKVVAAVQRVVGVTPDGVFGPVTLAAVQRWQKAHNTPGAQSGNVGPETWRAMGL